MTKPNVFIIGAPKCGTTSLANWLAEHPQVHFSTIKEPHFFNYDFGFRRPMSLAQYERLFAGATRKHRIVCEASTRYLYSRTAVPAVLAYVDAPRFIVMLRNPVNMAPSLHGQAIFSGDEDELDFERAWALQERRLYGDCIPKRCRDPQLLQYGTLCKLGKQVERLYQRVPRERVHAIQLENVQAAPREEWLRLMRFLNIEDDGRDIFPSANSAKVRSMRLLKQGIDRINNIVRTAGVPYVRTGFSSYVTSRLQRPSTRPPLSGDMRHHLEEYFSDDLGLLKRLGIPNTTATRQQAQSKRTLERSNQPSNVK